MDMLSRVVDGSHGVSSNVGTGPLISQPDDIFSYLFRYLSLIDFTRFSCSCKAVRLLAERAWHLPVEHDFGAQLSKIAQKLISQKYDPISNPKLIYKIYKKTFDQSLQWKFDFVGDLPFTLLNKKIRQGAATVLDDNRLVACHPLKKGLFFFSFDKEVPNKNEEYEDTLNRPLCLDKAPNQQLVIGCEDGSIQRRSLNNYAHKESYRPSGSAIQLISAINDHLTAYVDHPQWGDSGVVNVFDSRSNGVVFSHRLESFVNQEIKVSSQLCKITFIAKKPGGSHFAVGDRAFRVHLFSTNPLALEKTLDCGKRRPVSAQFFPDNRLLVASSKGEIFFLDPMATTKSKTLVSLTHLPHKQVSDMRAVSTPHNFIISSAKTKTSATTSILYVNHLRAEQFLAPQRIETTLTVPDAHKLYPLSDGRVAVLTPDHHIYLLTLDIQNTMAKLNVT